MLLAEKFQGASGACRPAVIFNWWQFVTSWLPSLSSRSFRLLQYFLAI